MPNKKKQPSFDCVRKILQIAKAQKSGGMISHYKDTPQSPGSARRTREGPPLIRSRGRLRYRASLRMSVAPVQNARKRGSFSGFYPGDLLVDQRGRRIVTGGPGGKLIHLGGFCKLLFAF
jgi:hypothetical protein